MLAFIDFEASSLNKDSYPVEVAWVFEDGRSEEFLLRPAPGWVEWDASAEAMHGLSREMLQQQGVPHGAVCDRLVLALRHAQIYATSPSWDGHWLSMLLRAAGRPRHLLRLADSDEALLEAARERLGPAATEAELENLIESARSTVAGEPVAHRALADARREWRIWRAIRGEA